MKAVVMTAPAVDRSTTSVAGIDEPRPGPGQVAIDVAYAGVNFIDVMARRGDPGYASAWPYVPGLEIAGTVRSVGSGVRDLHVGARVAAFTPGGGLAEVAVAAAAAEVTVEVPQEVPLGTAAPLVVSTALLLLLTDRARIRPGESVLMHSASGGIGSVVSQVAAALGSGRRIGTVGRPDKIAAGLAAGWDEVFAREAGLAEAVRPVAPDGWTSSWTLSARPCWIWTCRSRHPAGGSSCSAMPLAALRRRSRRPAASSAVTQACSGSA